MQELRAVLDSLRRAFDSGYTLDLPARRQALTRLLAGVQALTPEFNRALAEDLGVSTFCS
jgi:hypothetical protein